MMAHGITAIRGELVRGSAPMGAPPPRLPGIAPDSAAPQQPGEGPGLGAWLARLLGRLVAGALRPYGARQRCPGCGAPADRYAVPALHTERSYPPVMEFTCTLCSRSWREIASLDHWES